jgi:hypothetical protein
LRMGIPPSDDLSFLTCFCRVHVCRQPTGSRRAPDSCVLPPRQKGGKSLVREVLWKLPHRKNSDGRSTGAVGVFVGLARATLVSPFGLEAAQVESATDSVIRLLWLSPGQPEPASLCADWIGCSPHCCPAVLAPRARSWIPRDFQVLPLTG